VSAITYLTQSLCKTSLLLKAAKRVPVPTDDSATRPKTIAALFENTNFNHSSHLEAK
jgi:hypothetical protein